jgi:hypothetical protein
VHSCEVETECATWKIGRECGALSPKGSLVTTAVDVPNAVKDACWRRVISSPLIGGRSRVCDKVAKSDLQLGPEKKLADLGQSATVGQCQWTGYAIVLLRAVAGLIINNTLSFECDGRPQQGGPQGRRTRFCWQAAKI